MDAQSNAFVAFSDDLRRKTESAKEKLDAFLEASHTEIRGSISDLALKEEENHCSHNIWLQKVSVDIDHARRLVNLSADAHTRVATWRIQPFSTRFGALQKAGPSAVNG